MANNPKVNLALVDELPGSIVRGTIYMSPEDSGNFIKVGVDDSSVVTIFDGSNYAKAEDQIKKISVNGTELTPDSSGVVSLNVMGEEEELAISAALNDLNDRIIATNTNISYVEDYAVDINNRITDISNGMPFVRGQGANSAKLPGTIQNAADGSFAVAFGSSNGPTKAIGISSFAHGQTVFAIGAGSHAEGVSSYLTARYKVTGDANATTYTFRATTIGAPNRGDLVSYGTVYAYISDVDTIGTTGSDTYYIFSVRLNTTLSKETALSNTNVTLLRDCGAACGPGSHSEGSCIATGQDSHAEGLDTVATDQASHAEGNKANAFGQYAHAEGSYSLAYGQASHVEGHGGVAYGQGSHAEGFGKSSLLYWSLPSWRINGDVGATTYITSAAHNLKVGDLIQYNSTPYSGYNAIRMAKVTAVPSTTSFTVDHTLNPYTSLSNAGVYVDMGAAYGNYSHTEGKFTRATGQAAHAEGYYTKADASCSHAEGYATRTTYECAHAEGYYTVADASYSHAEGYYTITANTGEHAEGRYNMSHKVYNIFGNAGNTISVIGIGTASNNRKNAVEVMQNGDVYVINIGNYDGSNYIDASTLQEVIGAGGGGGSSVYTLERDTSVMTHCVYKQGSTSTPVYEAVVPVHTGSYYELYDTSNTRSNAYFSSYTSPSDKHFEISAAGDGAYFSGAKLILSASLIGWNFTSPVTMLYDASITGYKAYTSIPFEYFNNVNMIEGILVRYTEAIAM